VQTRLFLYGENLNIIVPMRALVTPKRLCVHTDLHGAVRCSGEKKITHTRLQVHTRELRHPSYLRDTDLFN